MKTLLKKCSLSLLLVLSLGLSACGFHLRGHYALSAPLLRMYVQTQEPYDPFVQELRRTLTKMNVTLTDTANEARVVLVLESMRSGQALISSSTTSQVNTYALTYSIVYSLQSPRGQVLVEPSTISASQNYTLSSNQAITGSAQEQQLRAQLYQDVINQLFNRLGSNKVKDALNHLS